MSNATTSTAKKNKKNKKAVAVAKRPVGRPPVNLNLSFGDRAFTVKDVRNRYAKSKNLITSVAITAKLKKMIIGQVPREDGKVLIASGRKIAGRGRPFTLFKWVTPSEAAKLAAVAAQSAETVAAE